jgi:hypothetical protein
MEAPGRVTWRAQRSREAVGHLRDGWTLRAQDREGTACAVHIDHEIEPHRRQPACTTRVRAPLSWRAWPRPSHNGHR